MSGTYSQMKVDHLRVRREHARRRHPKNFISDASLSLAAGTDRRSITFSSFRPSSVETHLSAHRVAMANCPIL